MNTQVHSNMHAQKSNSQSSFDGLNKKKNSNRPSKAGLPKKKTGSVLFVPHEVWVKTKKSQFAWADQEAIAKNYKSQVLLTFKAITSCCDVNGFSHVSLKGISQKRAEMFPGQQPCMRTIQNHIRNILDGGSIERSEQLGFKDLVTTKLIGYKEFSCQQHEKNSPVFICPTKVLSDRIIHTHSDKDVSHMNVDKNTEDAYSEWCEMRTKETNQKRAAKPNVEKIPTFTTAEHRETYGELRKLNVDVSSAIKWVNSYYLDNLERMIQHVCNNPKIKEPGAVLRTIIRESDERNSNNGLDPRTIRLDRDDGVRAIPQASPIFQPVHVSISQILSAVTCPSEPHIWRSQSRQQVLKEVFPISIEPKRGQIKPSFQKSVPTTDVGREAARLMEELGLNYRRN